MSATTCDAAQSASVLKEPYNQQLPLQIDSLLGEVNHTRSHVSITTKAVIEQPATTVYENGWQAMMAQKNYAVWFT